MPRRPAGCTSVRMCFARPMGCGEGMSNGAAHPRRFRGTSIQRKQTLVIILTSCVARALAWVGFITLEVISCRSAMVQNLSTLVGIIGNKMVEALNYGDRKDATEF